MTAGSGSTSDESGLAGRSVGVGAAIGGQRLAACDDSPAPPVRWRPVSVPGTIVVVIGGPIAPADVPRLCEHLGAVLERSDAQVVVCDVEPLVNPDLSTVDALARLAHTAGRLGCSARLRHASGELQDLLDLVGLRDVVPLPGRSPVETRGQAEQREQPRGVQKRVDPDDPTA